MEIKERVKRNVNNVNNMMDLHRRHVRSVETTADHLLDLNRDETLVPVDSIRTIDNTLKVCFKSLQCLLLLKYVDICAAAVGKQ